MSGIDRMSASIKKKITLNDYTPMNRGVEDASKQDIRESLQNNSNTSKGRDVNTSPLQNAFNEDNIKREISLNPMKEPKKIHKTTVYFSDKSKRQFDEIYAKRILAACETDKTDLLSEAIGLLYEREYTRQQA